MKTVVGHGLTAGLFTAATLLVIWWALGDSLDTRLIGMATVALTAPAFLACCGQTPDIVGVTGSIGLACFFCWIGSLGQQAGNLRPALSGVAIVLGVLAVECGAIAVLRGSRLGRVSGAAVTTVLIAVWLAWPVWQTNGNANLVRVHPLLAFNGVLAETHGVWTEQPVAYRYTVLGQDVFYAMPPSPWPCVATHLAAGLVLLTAGRALRWWRNRRQGGLRPDQ